jgi:hypothetical protein
LSSFAWCVGLLFSAPSLSVEVDNDDGFNGSVAVVVVVVVDDDDDDDDDDDVVVVAVVVVVVVTPSEGFLFGLDSKPFDKSNAFILPFIDWSDDDMFFLVSFAEPAWSSLTKPAIHPRSMWLNELYHGEDDGGGAVEDAALLLVAVTGTGNSASLLKERKDRNNGISVVAVAVTVAVTVLSSTEETTSLEDSTGVGGVANRCIIRSVYTEDISDIIFISSMIVVVVVVVVAPFQTD